MTGDLYSRYVLVMKVALPLIALGILSTLFLLSSRIDPGQSIPFADGEIADRVRGQQVTGPFFSGVTSNGDEVSFSARELSTGENNQTTAKEVSARLDIPNGGSIVLVATRADLNLLDDLVTLSGDVLVESTSGYKMRSDLVQTRLSRLDVTSPGEVRAVGPAGTLNAGMLMIAAPNSTSGVQLVFSKGVKLVYDPKDSN